MSFSAAAKKQIDENSSILQKIANNDMVAIEQCLNVYGGLVWSLSKKYCFTREDVEDAVQDIFIDIWRYAGRFDPEKSPETSFVTLIARRRLIDRARKNTHRPQLFFSEDILETQPSEAHQKLQFHLELKDALKGMNILQPKQKLVIQMAVFDGMSHREISQTTGLPLGTVKSQIRRGFQKIREYVGV